MKIIRDILLSVNREETAHTIFINDNGEQVSFTQSETRAKEMLSFLRGKALIPTSTCVELQEDYQGKYEIHETGLGITITIITYKGGKY